MRFPWTRPRHRQHRAAFTLIELMVVIVVIALLVGLLMPALFGVRSAVDAAQAQAEISQLETAIAAFKAEFGVEPPSRFVLPPSADPESMRIARRIWPQFSGHGGADAPPLSMTGIKILNGSECLVLFLGGSFEMSGGKFAMLGFAKNPRFPFGVGSSRQGPYFEFDVTRLQDTDGNGVPEYLQPLDGVEKPYVYLTSRGYKLPALDNNGNPKPPYNDAVSHSGGRIAQAYRQSPSKFWKNRSHQIIAAGADGEFGVGGLQANWKQADEDNLTNFGSGKLGSE